MRKFVKWWLPVLVWMGVIFCGSSIGSVPRIGGKVTDGVAHRVAHLIEFAVLGALTLRAVSKDRPITKRELIITVIVVALYGASDEFHQRFTPGRSSEGLSVLFDAAGGIIGAGLWWVRANKLLKRRILTTRSIAESDGTAES